MDECSGQIKARRIRKRVYGRSRPADGEDNNAPVNAPNWTRAGYNGSLKTSLKKYIEINETSDEEEDEEGGEEGDNKKDEVEEDGESSASGKKDEGDKKDEEGDDREADVDLPHHVSFEIF